MKTYQLKFLICLSLISVIGCRSSNDNAANTASNKQETLLSSAEKYELLVSLNDPLVSGMLTNGMDTATLTLFQILDLNSDGKKDVLFNGFGGASDEFVMIFLKDSTGWKKIIHDYGHVQQVLIGPKPLIELVKNEAVGESGGDSIVTFQILGFSYKRSSESKN